MPSMIAITCESVKAAGRRGRNLSRAISSATLGAFLDMAMSLPEHQRSVGRGYVLFALNVFLVAWAIGLPIHAPSLGQGEDVAPDDAVHGEVGYEGAVGIEARATDGARGLADGLCVSLSVRA